MKMCQISDFSHFSDKKNTWKKLLKGGQEEGSILAFTERAQPTVAGKDCVEECEAAGHVVSRVKKQRGMSAVSQLPFLFAFYQGPTPPMVPQSGSVTPSQFNIS